ncbi:bifunctional YncE family protein/alkaline phosphatase family protein, partial [Candidatus Sumerlaeota bacterium]|nr:bifunctional YncE family protein/alkaline phosphatase family protein [Candidatus Sumerlaeota bacterium]
MISSNGLPATDHEDSIRIRATWFFAFVLLVFAALTAIACVTPVRMSSPAGERPALRNVNGLSIIPNGRLLRPLGRQIVVPPHPFGLTLSPYGPLLAAISCGREPVAVTLISDLESDPPYVRQFPPGAETDEEDLRAAFMGLAFAPDRRTLYVSGGDDGTIVVFDLISGEKRGVIPCDTGDMVLHGDTPYVDSYIGEMALTRDGKLLFAVDQANFRLVVIDTASPPVQADGVPGSIIRSIPVGRYPFAVELSPDETTAYVANIGMFEYSVVRGIDVENPKTWMPFPPFGFDTPEARGGVTMGDIEVPGLGDPNVPESFSVWKIDLSGDEQYRVTGKIKTGVKVGELVEGIPAVGGSSPNSIAADERFIYVSNGSNDSVSVIDVRTFELVDSIDLGLSDIFGSLKGQIPFGLTLGPDGKRLYVCEAGINAIAVIETKRRRVIGHIPTAWFPSKVEVSRDGKKLFVSCAKGFGAGPNGGRDFTPPPGGSAIGNLMQGVIGIMDVPEADELAWLTRRVIENTVHIAKVNRFRIGGGAIGRNPIPAYRGAYESPIKHVVYITKENRTFDQVFGEYEKANGDSSLADFGLNATVRGQGAPTIEGVNVMPNHQSLARSFSISDNFYCDSDHSNDGHRWLVGTFPNTWVETATKVARRSGRMTSTAPGRRLMTGSSGAIYPEDYNEAGSIWEHLHRNGIEFFNFGLGFEFAFHDQSDYPDTGIRLAINYPMPAPLFERTSRTFATYNTSVPDQIRVNHFEEEFEERWLSGREPFPPVITMMLPNDHGARAAPERGYPYTHSYMADNDLALGRVVELLSHSPWWNEMVIIVTEDDAQGGQDHVDHHRSILMVISPYARRGWVSHEHTSFGSILKTIFLVHAIPYLNQYDAAATDLSDHFTPRPDFTPYTALP